MAAGGRLAAAAVSAVMIATLTLSISSALAAGGRGHASPPGHCGGHVSAPGQGDGHASPPGQGDGHVSPPGQGSG